MAQIPTSPSPSIPSYMREESEEETLADESEASSENPLAAQDERGDGAKPAKGGRRRSFFEKMKKQDPRLGDIDIDSRINYSRFSKLGPGLDSIASMQDDGRINISVKLKQIVPDIPQNYALSPDEQDIDPLLAASCPALSIVIFIVGSRGDVQPYLSLALRLILSNGHRVRIATHPDFKDFVLKANERLEDKKHNGKPLKGKLEFFDVGGDPKSLMAYMVKNPGLMPGWESMKNGDIGSKRRMTGEMLQGFYRSTFEPDTISQRPFVAEAIISNPPAFAHIHIAEALGIPCHMSFTMPWSTSTAFSHPLVNVKETNADQKWTNYISFAMADMLTWQGLGDVINAFRTATLGLEPLSARSGPSVLERTKVPWTYCWSEGLIEKPSDWKHHIDISGFYFLEADSDFKPGPELEKFLQAGAAPIYIGFGSVVVEDAAAMTQTIFDAVKQAGVRALVSAGWGGLGGTDIPENVFILKGNIPHDWLFADGRVAAVCHHGGAGTTAIGLRNGLPTIVVPFFGDQKFWGDMIHRAGGGPKPIPQKQLGIDNLAEAIKIAVSPEAKAAAGKMGEKIRSENGEEKGVQSFHAHLPLKSMVCHVTPSRSAQWWSPSLLLRLSNAAAGTLVDEGKIKWESLDHLRPKEYQTRWRAKDPVSGTAVGLMLMVSNHYGGIAQMFYKPSKGFANYATAIPQGLADVVMGLHEGFDAIPHHIGSETRERGKVDSFSSGMREGGKGLFYGWWDGITGLATEPIAGAKKEGPAGFAKGALRSWVNVTARPAAGILGSIALPLHGSWLALRRKIAGAPERAIRQPQESLATLEAQELSAKEKQDILSSFEKLSLETEERKKVMKKKAELFLMKMEEEEKEGEERKKGEGQAEGDAVKGSK